MFSSQHLIILNFLSVYLIWGSTYVLMKIASSELHPFAIIFWQNFIASIVLMVFNFKKDIIPYFIKNFRDLFTQSLLMLIFGVGFITIAVSQVSPAIAAIIIASVPLWVALFDVYEKKEIHKTKLFGVSLGLIGIYLLTAEENNSSSIFHLLLLIIAALSWSTGVIRSRNLKKLNDPFLTSIGQLFIASIAYFLLFITNQPLSDIVPSQSATIYSIIGLGTLGDALAFTSFIWLLKNVHPLLVSTYAYVNPVVSIFLSWLIFKESFLGMKLLYISLILFSVFITVTSKEEKPIYG